jgi:hypothetical protein
MKTTIQTLAAVAMAVVSGVALASEGGGTVYAGGSENYLAGAVPPPGFYLLAYGEAYRANSFRGNDGKDQGIPGFKVQANAFVLRPVWSTPYEVLGGNLVLHTVLPLLNLKVQAAGTSQTKTGFGDMTIGAGIAMHHSQELHSVLALDVVLPTGGYDKSDLANIGRNYVAFEPLYAMSYVNPTGFNGDFKMLFNLNRTNRDTQYRSGNEVIVDYAAGYGVGSGWTVGVGGYVRQQFKNDEQDGNTVADNKARVFAIGPSVKYDNGKGWFITAKLQAETAVRNSTRGNAFWVKALIPF